MEDGLPAIRTCVDHQPVSTPFQPGFSCQAAGGEEHVPEQTPVGGFGIIHGFDMLDRHDQDMHRGNRAGILETDQVFIAVEDTGRDFSGNDPAKGTTGGIHQ